MTTPNEAHSGTVSIAGDLTVNRLGYGAMRITGEGIWGDPKKPQSANASKAFAGFERKLH